MKPVSAIISSIVKRREPATAPHVEQPVFARPSHPSQYREPEKFELPDNVEDGEELLNLLTHQAIQCRSAMEHAVYQRDNDPHYQFDGHWYVRAKAKLGYLNQNKTVLAKHVSVMRKKIQRETMMEDLPVSEEAKLILNEPTSDFPRRYNLVLLDVIKKNTSADQYQAWLDEARRVLVG